jgi:2-keto-4-pentenoate hydratase/2-oxohepta-3-ene-1,7-dioic acid hydratase in catechol pathway
MDQNRRGFLKQAGVASAAAVAGGSTLVAPMAAAAAGAGKGAKPDAVTMPRQMTFVTLSRDGTYSLGVKTARGILDVRKAAMHHKSAVPTTIDDLIRVGDRGLGELVRAAVEKGGKALFLDEGSITFGPSVTNPEKILCVGLNYARHARETNNPVPKLPILFNKFNNALNSHQGTVRVSDVPAEKFDYESELVIVMGKRAHKVSEAEAPSYVFGYCNGNDFTARDLQQRSSQWMIGKTFNGSGLLGPYLVTADQVDQNNLKIEGTVNGEVRQSSNTNDMVFNCAQIISYASNLMTLEPGDIIYTGTPEGVISGYAPEKQKWLKPGDKLTTTIGNLGTLRFSLA